LKFLRFNPYFFIPFLFALFLGAVILVVTGKGTVLLLINKNHSVFFDNLFYLGTSLGNALLYIVVIFILAGINYGNSFIALLSLLQTAVLVQVLKHTLFNDVIRPKLFFNGIEKLHFVDGVQVHSYHSFPSGHTATAFSLFCLLSLIIPNKKLGVVMILFALIGGISRIYLAQHFFIDVYFGAILGVIVTTLTVYFVPNSKWFLSKKWTRMKLRDHLK